MRSYLNSFLLFLGKWLKNVTAQGWALFFSFLILIKVIYIYIYLLFRFKPIPVKKKSVFSDTNLIQIKKLKHSEMYNVERGGTPKSYSLEITTNNGYT